jgi:hypothetical protein
MWIMMKQTAIFLAAEKGDDRIMVRSRRVKDITVLFPGAEVIHTPGNDYQFRAMIDADEVGSVVAKEIADINYRRFKPEVKDHALHDSYMSCWHGMLGIQEPGTGGMYNRR